MEEILIGTASSKLISNHQVQGFICFPIPVTSYSENRLVCPSVSHILPHLMHIAHPYNVLVCMRLCEGRKGEGRSEEDLKGLQQEVGIGGTQHFL